MSFDWFNAVWGVICFSIGVLTERYLINRRKK